MFRSLRSPPPAAKGKGKGRGKGKGKDGKDGKGTGKSLAVGSLDVVVDHPPKRGRGDRAPSKRKDWKTRDKSQGPRPRRKPSPQDPMLRHPQPLPFRPVCRPYRPGRSQGQSLSAHLCHRIRKAASGTLGGQRRQVHAGGTAQEHQRSLLLGMRHRFGV